MTNHLYVEYIAAPWVGYVCLAGFVAAIIVFAFALRAYSGAWQLVSGAAALASIVTVMAAVLMADDGDDTILTEVRSAHVAVVESSDGQARDTAGITMIDEAKIVRVCELRQDSSEPIHCQAPKEPTAYDQRIPGLGHDLGPVSSLDEAVQKVWG